MVVLVVWLWVVFVVAFYLISWVFGVDGFVCLMCLFAMVVPLGIWGVLFVTRCLGLGLVFV